MMPSFRILLRLLFLISPSSLFQTFRLNSQNGIGFVNGQVMGDRDLSQCAQSIIDADFNFDGKINQVEFNIAVAIWTDDQVPALTSQTLEPIQSVFTDFKCISPLFCDPRIRSCCEIFSDGYIPLDFDISDISEGKANLAGVCVALDSALTLISDSFPSSAPSIVPNESIFAPTVLESDQPSLTPSVVPTIFSSDFPSVFPTTSFPSTSVPTKIDSDVPSISSKPSTSPTFTDSEAPTELSSSFPSMIGTQFPSKLPSMSPSLLDSAVPSVSPSVNQSVVPSTAPSFAPSGSPSLINSTLPSITPTLVPTIDASDVPTLAPSIEASDIPSQTPTESPTFGKNVSSTYTFCEKNIIVY